MSEGGTGAIDGAGTARPLQAAFTAATKRATASLQGLTLLLSGLASLVVAYYAFTEKLKLREPWPAVICGLFLCLFLIVFFLPEFLDQLRLQRLKMAGIGGRLVDPSYFRLSAYEADDSTNFSRADTAAADACRWIEAAAGPLLYLSGQSGTGKSSLINAAIKPMMAGKGWAVVTMRPHDAPFRELAAALSRGAATAGDDKEDAAATREAIERATRRARRDGLRLLLVIDQFEEALLLAGPETRAALSALLRGLHDRPVPGLTVLLSLRAEYLNDLPEFGLEPPAFGPGQNSFEVRPFSRAAAAGFMRQSGLEIAPGLLERVLEEACEIEDMPDRVRPIVLNMFGLVIGSFTGSLPKGVTAGGVLTGYIERSLKRSQSQALAVKVMRPLVTDAGTKRALATEQIAARAGVTTLVARGCLIGLANDGLVRRLEGKPEKWEVAHDFVAKLLQPVLRTWRGSVWARARPYVAPGSLAGWTLLIGGVILFYPTLHDAYVLGRLRTVGLVPGVPEAAGARFEQNGLPIGDNGDFWRVAASLDDLTTPVVALDLSRNKGIATVSGMPRLAHLMSLDLRGTGVTTLEGMPRLPTLTTLDLPDGAVRDLRGMPELPEVASLTLSGLRTLGGMPRLPKLRALDLRNSQLKTLEGMPAFPALRSLVLSGSGLESLRGMPVLPTLESLDLSETRLAELTGMPSLSALRSLNLGSTRKLESLRGMPPLPGLVSLHLSQCPMESLREMPMLPALAELSIDLCRIRSFEGLPAQPALVSLEVRLGALRSLRGLPSLPALTRLKLMSVRQLESLQGLPPLPQLTSLYISQNNFSGQPDLVEPGPVLAVRDLPLLPTLTEVSLVLCRISDLHGMPAWPRVVSLDLSGSTMATLDGMPTLGAMTSLNLSDARQLKDFRGMPSQPYLAELDISGSRIDTLTSLPQMPAGRKIKAYEGQLAPSSLDAIVSTRPETGTNVVLPFEPNWEAR